ncbi:hypothetical protein [Alkaliphilus sp. B6464]|nr:hypothetical protein [Alkaliphilus sp. B6464]QUH22011.1 hypothetical protein HYG84_19085 [Alkaliphilus sp. B6464]
MYSIDMASYYYEQEITSITRQSNLDWLNTKTIYQVLINELNKRNLKVA